MKQELKRIEPLRTANIGALVYGLLLGAFALIFSPFVLMAAFMMPSEGAGVAGPAFMLGMLVLYPVMGVVMGWLSGLLTAAIYNLVIRWTGGLLFELDAVAPTSSGGAV